MFLSVHRKAGKRAEKMVSWVKNPSHNHKDLSSDPQTVWWWVPVSPGLMRWEAEMVAPLERTGRELLKPFW